MISTISYLTCSASDGHQRLRMTMKRPAQITGHQINRHRREHQNHAEPDAPVPMRPPPIRWMALVNWAAIRISVRFVIVL